MTHRYLLAIVLLLASISGAAYENQLAFKIKGTVIYLMEKENRCYLGTHQARGKVEVLDLNLTSPCDVMTHGALEFFEPVVKEIDAKKNKFFFRIVGQLKYNEPMQAECGNLWQDVLFDKGKTKISLIEREDIFQKGEHTFCPRLRKYTPSVW